MTTINMKSSISDSLCNPISPIQRMIKSNIPDHRATPKNTYTIELTLGFRMWKRVSTQYRCLLGDQVGKAHEDIDPVVRFEKSSQIIHECHRQTWNHSYCLQNNLQHFYTTQVEDILTYESLCDTQDKKIV